MNHPNIVPIVLLGLLSAGCQPSARDSTTQPPIAETQPPIVETEVEPSSEAGEQKQRVLAAKDELFQKLSTRLMQALEEEDAASAVSVCKKEAPRIASEVGENHRLRIGRTSFRLRNPENVAPEWAQPMVDKRVGEAQFKNLDDGRFTALLPIRLQPLCMTCHGPEDQIAEAIKTALAREYPNDQATGLKTGDLRGWFWVEVPAS